MKSKAVTREVLCSQHLLTRDAAFTDENWMSIYSRKMESTPYTHDSWSKLHLPMRDGVQDMYS